jgi:hypothetical protein
VQQTGEVLFLLEQFKAIAADLAPADRLTSTGAEASSEEARASAIRLAAARVAFGEPGRRPRLYDSMRRGWRSANLAADLSR